MRLVVPSRRLRAVPLLLALLFCAARPAVAQPDSGRVAITALLAESFDDGIPDDWTVHQGTYATFDGRWRPAMDGSRTVARSWYTHPWDNIPPGSYAEDLLVTPPLALGAQPLLRFDARRQAHSGDVSWGAYRVLVAPAGDGPPPSTLDAYDEVARWTLQQFTVGWRTYEVDLAAYEGMEVYVAFAHVHNRHNVFILDDVVVTSPLSVAEARAQPLGSVVTTLGVVSRAAGDEAHLQDDTAGLSVHAAEGSFRDAIASGSVRSGAHVLVTGPLVEREGMRYLDLTGSDAWEVQRHGRAPDALPVTLQGVAASGEALQSRFVLVRRLALQGAGPFVAGARYAASDPSGAGFEVLVPLASALPGTAIPDGPVDALGVVGRTAEGPVLMLLAPGDLRPPPPTRSLAFDLAGIDEVMDAGTTRSIPAVLANASGAPVGYRVVTGFAESPGGDRTYAWSSNAMEGGITTEPLDIRHTGRPLTLQPTAGCSGASAEQDAFAPVLLPFEMPFYGSRYASVYVSSNGFVTFDGETFNGGCARALAPLPSTSVPRASIVAFGRILEARGLGRIHTEHLPDGRFAIQYTDWALLGQPASRITFQILLAPSGLIELQYLAMDYQPGGVGLDTHAGVQDGSRTRGLTVYRRTYADPIIEDDVLVAPMLGFATLAPPTATVPAGGTLPVDVVLDAGALIEGTYTGQLILESTEGRLKYALPVALQVIGEAACAVSPNPIDFGSVIVGRHRSIEATVTNHGTAPCALTGASVEAEDVLVGFVPVTLAPFASTTLEASFTPGTVGPLDGTLVLHTPDGPVTAGLTGFGAAPPVASFDPPALAFYLDPEGPAVGHETVALSNVGPETAAELEYAVSIDLVRDARGDVLVREEPAAERLAAVQAGLRHASGSPAPAAYVRAAPGPMARRTDFELAVTHSVSMELTPETGVACGGLTHTRDNSFWRVFDLAAYHDIGPTYTVTRVEVGVEVATHPLDSWIVLYRLDGPLARENLTELSTTPFQITPGALHLQAVPIPPTEIAGDATLVVEWRIADGRLVPANVYPGANRQGQTGPTYLSTESCELPGDIVDLAVIGFPEVHWVMRVTGQAAPGVVAITPRAGSVAPGASAELSVTANVETLAPGVHPYRILFHTNEPAHPVRALDVTLHVGPVGAEGPGEALRFALDQNYPNPFHRSTTIAFEVPHAAEVAVDVLDLMGRRVAVLLDGRVPAGRHALEWDAANLAGGVYLVRMRAGDFREARRMVLLR